MNDFLGLFIGLGMLKSVELICLFIWGEEDVLGLFIVFSRKYNFTKWLTWRLWGDDCGYIDRLEAAVLTFRSGEKAWKQQ